MDPQARRITWELIAKEKQFRTIILTTHYMDEADNLGDRIAIMANGKVRCCGSSLFLKRLYGVGYSFTVSLPIGVDPNKAKPAIDKIIFQHVPRAQSLSVAGGEIAFRLPFEHSNAFADMFEALDATTTVQINSYGISVTTLEEVFLKIGHDDEPMVEGAVENAAVESEVPSPVKSALRTKIGSESIASTSGHFNFNEKKDELLFNASTFKLDVGRNASFLEKFQKEFFIFWLHAYAILYRRYSL